MEEKTAWWNRHLEEYIETLKRYVAFKSVAVPGKDGLPFGRDNLEMLRFMEAEMKKTGVPNESYVMPDGGVVNLGNERFRCAELMFNPRLDYFEYDGIHRVIYDAIMNCASDARKDLFANICLFGGNSILDGFPERIEKEVACLAPKEMKVKVHAPPERKYSVWIGGSLLGSWESFASCAVSRSEYKEVGPRIVHEKCPF